MRGFLIVLLFVAFSLWVHVELMACTITKAKTKAKSTVTTTVPATVKVKTVWAKPVKVKVVAVTPAVCAPAKVAVCAPAACSPAKPAVCTPADKAVKTKRVWFPRLRGFKRVN